MLRKLFIGYYNPSVILTYFGVALSVAGICAAISGHTRTAIILMIAAFLADLFDGPVARRIKRTAEEKSFGVQIDTLSDLIGFAALPVVILASLGQTAWYEIAAYMLLVLAAISRLGLFNVVSESTEPRPAHFTGWPVSFSGATVALAWIWFQTVGSKGFSIFLTAAVILTALMFIANVRFPKPRGRGLAVVAVAALVLIAVVSWVGL